MDVSGESPNVVMFGPQRKHLGRSRVTLHLKKIFNDGMIGHKSQCITEAEYRFWADFSFIHSITQEGHVSPVCLAPC